MSTAGVKSLTHDNASRRHCAGSQQPAADERLQPANGQNQWWERLVSRLRWRNWADNVSMAARAC